MGLKVEWTEFAENQLLNIFEFYYDGQNKSYCDKIIESLIKRTFILESNPFIGQIEDWLQNRFEQNRYLIEGNYTIIYFVDESINTVYITNVFDCRQESSRILRTK